MKKILTHSKQRHARKSLPISGIILVILLLSTFLTVLVAEQQQENRSQAQTAQPLQQACVPGTNLTKPEADKLQPFCKANPDATLCKDFCKRTGDTAGAATSELCKPGGVYSCEAAAGATAKGTCQAGVCATSPRTGTDSYCGGGQTCCEAPKPEGGTCTKPADCVAGLDCTGGKCSNPPVQPGGNVNDRDGDGLLNDNDPNPDKAGDKAGIDGKPNPGGPNQINIVPKTPAAKAPGGVPKAPAACRGIGCNCAVSKDCNSGNCTRQGKCASGPGAFQPNIPPAQSPKCGGLNPGTCPAGSVCRDSTRGYQCVSTSTGCGARPMINGQCQ